MAQRSWGQLTSCIRITLNSHCIHSRMTKELKEETLNPAVQNNHGVRGIQCGISSTHKKSSKENAENELILMWAS